MFYLVFAVAVVGDLSVSAIVGLREEHNCYYCLCCC